MQVKVIVETRGGDRYGVGVLNMGTFELTHQSRSVLVAAIDKAILDYQWANDVQNLADKDPIQEV